MRGASAAVQIRIGDSTFCIYLSPIVSRTMKIFQIQIPVFEYMRVDVLVLLAVDVDGFYTLGKSVRPRK